MNRQFRFYQLPPQIDELISELKERVGLRLIAARSPIREPIELASALETIQESATGQQVVHVHCYLVPTFEAPLSMNYAPRINEWHVESERSEVIQFNGCRYDGKELSIGRFYFRTDYLNGKKDALVPHRDIFRKWGDQIFRRAKGHLRYSPELEAYVDEESDRWRQQGGNFVGL